MIRPSSEDPHAPHTHAPPRDPTDTPPLSKVAKIVLASIVLALGGWIAVRIQTAMSAKEAMAKAAEAQAAGQRSGPGSAAAPSGDGVARAAPVTTADKKEAGPHSGAVVFGTPDRWRPEVRVEGTLSPIRDADIGFKVGGRLGAIRVKSGEAIKQGAVLGMLEASEATAGRAGAEAQVRAAEAQVALAEDAERRMSKMSSAGAMPDMNVVQAKSQLRLASAQLDGAKAQLDLATVALGNHTLAAPFAGVVTRVPTAPGVIVGPGIPLFHLTDVSTLRLAGTVSEEDASLLSVGATVNVETREGSATGKITAILPALDPMTRRVPVEAELDNKVARPLRAGAFVRAMVESAKDVPVLRFPMSVLRPGVDGEVLVAADGKLALRRVAYAVSGDGTILIRQGVDEKDAVLLTPTTSHRPGDAIEVRK